MIEKDISDSTLVEEFSTPQYTDREKLIRQLVQLASLVIVGLLIVNFLHNLELNDYLRSTMGLISLVLLLFLLVIFLIGLGISFFQLRFVNERRRKTTNLGGTVGLFGLFLTGIPCSCELLLPGVIFSNILTVVLGLGLFLIVIGVFAEVSQIDEIVIYFIRLNFGVFVRYIFTIIGSFLINWGILTILGLILLDWGVLYQFIWPGNMFGGVILVITGIFVVWGSWLHQINQVVWENRVFILRSILLTISQILIIIITLFLFSLPNTYQTLSEAFSIFSLSVIIGICGLLISYIDLYISKVKIKHQFSGVTRILSVIFMSLIGVILIFIGFFVQLSLEWLIIQFYYSGMGVLLLYRVWFDNINQFTKKTFQTSIRFFTTYYRHFVTILALCLIIMGFVGWSVVEAAFAFFFAGYLLGAIIWYIPSRHNYFRGVTTTLSVILIFWGLAQLILAFDLLTFIIYGGTGTVLPVFLWRVELKQLIIQVVLGFQKFLLAYYRHLVTILATVLMFIGSLGPLIIGSYNFFDLSFISIFLLGYFSGSMIWYKHSKFRGITTTLSSIVLIWGMFLLSEVDFTEFATLLITGGFIVTGIGVDGYLWRRELKQLIGKTMTAAVVFFKRTLDVMLNSLRIAWKALKRAWRRFVLFLRTYKWDILKYSGTLIGILLLLAGPPLMGLIFATTVEPILDLYVRAIGLVFIVLVWHKEIMRILKATWVALVQAVDNLVQLLRKYRSEVFKYSTTIVGFLLLLSGPLLLGLIFAPEFISNFDLGIRGVGIALLGIAWYAEIIRFMKASWAVSKQAWRAFIDFLKATGTALVQAVDNFAQFLRNYQQKILKYSVTLIGALLLLVGPPLVGLIFTLDLALNFDFWIRLIGLVLLGLAWHKEIIQLLKASWTALKRAWRRFVLFLRTYRWEILKYSGTIIGFVLLLAGPPLINLILTITIEPLIDLLIRASGFGFIVLAWHEEIIRLLKASWTALKQAWKALKNIVSRTFSQIIDLTIPISMFTIAIIIGLYGFLLVVTMFIDQNHTIDRFLIDNIPLLENIAQIFQPGNYASEGWGEEWGGSLLGFFNGFPPIMNVVLGTFIVAAALYIMYIVGLKYRENLRLNTLFKTSEPPVNISIKKRV
ncbi:MAG: hypothetical protein ACFE8U_03920 [Candidatus Hermodarchaeota archaeon]